MGISGWMKPEGAIVVLLQLPPNNLLAQFYNNVYLRMLFYEACLMRASEMVLQSKGTAHYRLVVSVVVFRCNTPVSSLL